jgi:hypothetical protein
MLEEVKKLRKIALVSIALICLMVFSVAYGLAIVPLRGTDNERPCSSFEPQDNPRPYVPLPVKPVDNPRPY